MIGEDKREHTWKILGPKVPQLETTTYKRLKAVKDHLLELSNNLDPHAGYGDDLKGAVVVEYIDGQEIFRVLAEDVRDDMDHWTTILGIQS